jgi:nucleotide-binding universal stress UspA family protein
MKKNLLTSVVVATDFSPGGQLALDRALRLPLHPKARLEVLHVVPDGIPGKLRKQALGEALAGLEKLVAARQEALAARGLSASQVGLEVIEGAVAAKVARHARAVDADVVVIGRHGRRPVADLFLGSTAQKIVRRGETPVLLVQLPPEVPYGSVVAGLDLEAPSLAVLKASQLVSPGARVRAVTASVATFEDYVSIPGELALELRDQLLEDARVALTALLAKAGVQAEGAVKPGDPRLVLLEEARAAEASLIVVGSHGRKGIKRLFLGSVAEWVLGHATCDVLVVRT